MHIINAVLRLQHFPTQWKIAIVVTIWKPGKNPSDPNSYRPISLLNTLGKVAERLILSRINGVVENLRVMPDEQFGFRAGHHPFGGKDNAESFRHGISA